MMLSSIATVSDRVVVTAPETVGLPLTTASPDTVGSANVAEPASGSFVPKSPATANVVLYLIV